jgi:hypothetical protein
MKLSINLKSHSAAARRIKSPQDRARDRMYQHRARKVVEQVIKVAKDREAEMLQKAKKENWPKERIAAYKNKLAAAVIKAKAKANAVFTGQGLAAPYAINTKDLAIITDSPTLAPARKARIIRLPFEP